MLPFCVWSFGHIIFNHFINNRFGNWDLEQIKGVVSDQKGKKGINMELNFRDFFKALSNENRIKIMMLIFQKGKVTPTEIVNRFYLEQPTVARHLTMLERCGLIKRTRLKPRTEKAHSSREVYCTLEMDFIMRGFMEFFHYLMIQRESGDENIKLQFLENTVSTSKVVKPKAIGFFNSSDELTVLKMTKSGSVQCL